MTSMNETGGELVPAKRFRTERPRAERRRLKKKRSGKQTPLPESKRSGNKRND
jgi:hypothetical protein